MHQAASGRTAPGTPEPSAGGRVPHSACVSAEPPAVLTGVCEGEAANMLPHIVPPDCSHIWKFPSFKQTRKPLVLIHAA